jgi:4-amino-4-deoxy-L-arabinose transferase-like glycosyltransferase
VIPGARFALARRILVAALGAWLSLYATAPLGPSISPDSAIYLSVADNLMHGSGFTQFDDQPMTRWAPLYPALLAGAAPLFGGDAGQAARAVNALAWAIALFLLCGWLDRHVKSWVVRAASVFTLVAAPMLLQCVAFVWSEAIYLALALAALAAWEALGAHALETGGDRRIWLVLLGIATGAAVMARYAGIALVPVALAALVLTPSPRKPRASEVLLVSALALVPLLAWLARNQVLTGLALGEGWGAHSDLARNAAILVHIVSLWWFWPSVAVPLRLLFVGAVVSACAIALFRLVRAGALAAPATRAAVVSQLSFVVSSVGVLLVWASISGIETISDRYAAPLFPSVVLLAAWALDRMVSLRAGTGLAISIAIAGAVLAWHSAERTAMLVRLYRGPGEWGYRTRGWEQSGTMASMSRIVPPGALVYSSAPDAIYARLRRPARLLPVGPEVDGPQRAERELRAARGAIEREGGAWVVEFDGVHRAMLAPTEALAGTCPTDTVTRASDGTILWIRCSSPPSPPTAAPAR